MVLLDSSWQSQLCCFLGIPSYCYRRLLFPLFFDSFTHRRLRKQQGQPRAVLIMPFISGLLQVFQFPTLITGWVGMAAYGGYLGMCGTGQLSGQSPVAS